MFYTAMLKIQASHSIYLKQKISKAMVAPVDFFITLVLKMNKNFFFLNLISACTCTCKTKKDFLSRIFYVISTYLQGSMKFLYRLLVKRGRSDFFTLVLIAVIKASNTNSSMSAAKWNSKSFNKYTSKGNNNSVE